MRLLCYCSIVAAIATVHSVARAQTAEILFQSDLPGDQELFVMEGDGSNKTNLTNNVAAEFLGDWSPDGTQAVFSTDRDGNFEIYTMDIDGSNLVRLTNNGDLDAGPRWSSDGLR